MYRLAFCAARWSLFAFSLVALSLFAGTASGADVVLIEEHWELQVGGPDPARSAPQVTMVMSPNGTLFQEHFLLTLNHHTHPDFVAGGIQVQRWYGEECESASSISTFSPLASDGEVFTWIQRLSIANGKLKFEVIGNSPSWGNFGDDGELTLSHSSSIPRLNSYLPAISINESGIGYAGNRVSSLTLKRIRWVTDDQQEHELVAPIDIDTDLDP